MQPSDEEQSLLGILGSKAHGDPRTVPLDLKPRSARRDQRQEPAAGRLIAMALIFFLAIFAIWGLYDLIAFF